MQARDILPPIFIQAYRRVTRVPKSTHQVGSIAIDVPPKHPLREYQERNRLYDKFLPVLARNLPLDESTIIVDIGANIGDTTIGILQECRNRIISVEPSDLFYPFLEKNLLKVSSEERARVKAIKQLVGTGRFVGDLVHLQAGTAHIRPTAASSKNTHPVPLDDLVESRSRVVLVKVDTDGFDFDVLLSAKHTLSSSKPILFWENAPEEDYHQSGFEELYEMLESLSYKHIFVFDNFGNLMTEEISYRTLKHINSYLISMSRFRCTRTIHYVDILAATDEHAKTVHDAIADYKSNFIFNTEKALQRQHPR
jgi:FkbM family methyltransferase